MLSFLHATRHVRACQTPTVSRCVLRVKKWVPTMSGPHFYHTVWRSYVRTAISRFCFLYLIWILKEICPGSWSCSCSPMVFSLSTCKSPWEPHLSSDTHLNLCDNYLPWSFCLCRSNLPYSICVARLRLRFNTVVVAKRMNAGIYFV